MLTTLLSALHYAHPGTGKALEIYIDRRPPYREDQGYFLDQYVLLLNLQTLAVRVGHLDFTTDTPWIAWGVTVEDEHYCSRVITSAAYFAGMLKKYKDLPPVWEQP